MRRPDRPVLIPGLGPDQLAALNQSIQVAYQSSSLSAVSDGAVMGGQVAVAPAALPIFARIKGKLSLSAYDGTPLTAYDYEFVESFETLGVINSTYYGSELPFRWHPASGDTGVWGPTYPETALPAVELNGHDVPDGTIVELFSGGNGPFYWFNYNGGLSGSVGEGEVAYGGTGGTITSDGNLTWSGQQLSISHPQWNVGAYGLIGLEFASSAGGNVGIFATESGLYANQLLGVTSGAGSYTSAGIQFQVWSNPISGASILAVYGSWSFRNPSGTEVASLTDAGVYDGSELTVGLWSSFEGTLDNIAVVDGTNDRLLIWDATDSTAKTVAPNVFVSVFVSVLNEIDTLTTVGTIDVDADWLIFWDATTGTAVKLSYTQFFKNINNFPEFTAAPDKDDHFLMKDVSDSDAPHHIQFQNVVWGFRDLTAASSLSLTGDYFGLAQVAGGRALSLQETWDTGGLLTVETTADKNNDLLFFYDASASQTKSLLIKNLPLLSVREADGSPVYNSINNILLNQDGGLYLTQPGTGSAQINIYDAAYNQTGVITASGQEIGGVKTFTGGYIQIQQHGGSGYATIGTYSGGSWRQYLSLSATGDTSSGGHNFNALMYPPNTYPFFSGGYAQYGIFIISPDVGITGGDKPAYAVGYGDASTDYVSIGKYLTLSTWNKDYAVVGGLICGEAAGGTAPSLNDLSDVTTTTPSSGDVLTYSGSAWVNSPPSAASLALDDLTDVSATSPAAYTLLTWDTANWSPYSLQGILDATSSLGFFAATPVTQPSTTGTTSGHTAGASTGLKVDDTFDGGLGGSAYTVGDVVRALKQLGLLAP